MSNEIRVPDIGDFDAVDVIEVLIKAGDSVENGQSVLVLESDKASMEVPADIAGTVANVSVKVGDKVKQGDLIATLSGAAAAPAAAAPAPAAEAPKAAVAPAAAADVPAQGTSSVRVRFCPSPTGTPHVGMVRTCLFNWAYARHTGGTFVFRIEDTDAARDSEESFDAILDSLTWLGLDWDEGVGKGGPHEPYRQSQRMDLYKEGAAEPLEAG